MLNITMLGPYPLDEDAPRGGVEATVQTLASELAKIKNCRLHIISLNDKGVNGESLSKAGVAVTQIAKAKYFGNIMYNIPDVARICLEARKIPTDLIHAQGTGVYMQAALRLPYTNVMTVNGIIEKESKQWSGMINGIRRRIILQLERYCLLKAQSVIAITEYVKKSVASYTTAHFFRVDVAVDNAFYEIHSRENELQILFVGVISERKGLHNLINAMSIVIEKIPRGQLRIVGPCDDAAYKAYLWDLIDKGNLRDNIKFLGHVSKDVLLNEYAESAVIVLPSFEESAGIVIAQAMALGKPVVATERGGIPDIVENKTTGILVKYDDIESLADAIIYLLNNRELRLQFGKRAREIALMRFLPSVVAQKTYDVYSVIARKGL